MKTRKHHITGEEAPIMGIRAWLAWNRAELEDGTVAYIDEEAGEYGAYRYESTEGILRGTPEGTAVYGDDLIAWVEEGSES